MRRLKIGTCLAEEVSLRGRGMSLRIDFREEHTCGKVVSVFDLPLPLGEGRGEGLQKAARMYLYYFY
jgi:hypothetical protein